LIYSTHNGDDTPQSRMDKASVALMQLYKNKNILVTTKIQLFQTRVKSVLLYGSAIWKITERISNSL